MPSGFPRADAKSICRCHRKTVPFGSTLKGDGFLLLFQSANRELYVLQPLCGALISETEFVKCLETKDVSFLNLI